MKTATAIVQMSPHLSANAQPPQHPALMLFKERIVVFTVYWILLIFFLRCVFLPLIGLFCFNFLGLLQV
jgi:hypothetical protein